MAEGHIDKNEKLSTRGYFTASPGSGRDQRAGSVRDEARVLSPERAKNGLRRVDPAAVRPAAGSGEPSGAGFAGEE
jgi:hypothetical protein